MTDARIEAALNAAWKYTWEAEAGVDLSTFRKRKPDVVKNLEGAFKAALAAADAAAWRLMETAPKDGTVIEIFQGNRNGWRGIGIATARFWTAAQLATLDGSSNPDDYEDGWYLASNYWGEAEDETCPWLWRPHMPPPVKQQETALQQVLPESCLDPYPKPDMQP